MGSVAYPSLLFQWTRLLRSSKSAQQCTVVPCARSSHGVSIVNQRLIVHGGENLTRTPISHEQGATWGLPLSHPNISRGSPSSSLSSSSSMPSWYMIDASMIPPRLGHSQAVLGDQLYVFGGRSGVDMHEQALNDLLVLDCSGPPGDETWKQGPDLYGDVIEPRSFHQMLGIHNHLYIFGGCGTNSGRLADLHRLDPLTGCCTYLGSSDVRGRGGANLLSIDSQTKLAVVAGFAGEETNDGDIFRLADGIWEGSSDLTSQLSSMRPRSVCVSASFPSIGVALLFGGEVHPSTRAHEGAGSFVNDIVVLDETNASYQTTTFSGSPTVPTSTDSACISWPEPRGWADGAAIDHGDGTGTLYVFGGLTGDDYHPKRLDDLWRLDISVSK